MHDRVVVLPQHRLPLVQPLRSSLYDRRNKRLGIKDVCPVAVISVHMHPPHFTSEAEVSGLRAPHDKALS